ncbi:hypothetical protein M431DRAFT_239480 [Trichoderma harzianum CBS 226.95]|uniref:Ig-like domain-containing protein n=1 Tax=Trichoderma harzianum CBS 226.95 TaxID=983964 RepID=A0A2T4A2N6_TRIHA|nr:hypothetical protein M431DRAFT_239480 [Trichoderma harzianum CBS 226.95]PTB51314.1 hypothetical protein M431DRAFT_239480 [Trichoderma harzianum CBS 226.95]
MAASLANFFFCLQPLTSLVWVRSSSRASRLLLMGSAHARFRVLFLHQAVSAFPFLFCHRPQSQSSFAHFPSVSEPSVTWWSRHPIPSRQAYCSPRFEASPLPELASRTLAESRACGWNGQSEVRRSLNFSQEGAPLQFLRQFVALFCKLGRQNRLKTGVCACRIEQSVGWGDSRRHSPAQVLCWWPE